MNKFLILFLICFSSISEAKWICWAKPAKANICKHNDCPLGTFFKDKKKSKAKEISIKGCEEYYYKCIVDYCERI